MLLLWPGFIALSRESPAPHSTQLSPHPVLERRQLRCSPRVLCSSFPWASHTRGTLLLHPASCPSGLAGSHLCCSAFNKTTWDIISINTRQQNQTITQSITLEWTISLAGNKQMPALFTITTTLSSGYATFKRRGHLHGKLKCSYCCLNISWSPNLRAKQCIGSY